MGHSAAPRRHWIQAAVAFMACGRGRSRRGEQRGAAVGPRVGAAEERAQGVAGGARAGLWRRDLLRRRLAALHAEGDVALISHGHYLRVLCATWLHLAPQHGADFNLSTGTFSLPGFEHEYRTILHWNERVTGVSS